MANFAIKAGKGGRKSVPVEPARASFILGSRPPDVREPAPPRIKPALGQRQYGKGLAPANPGSGNTGLTGMS